MTVCRSCHARVIFAEAVTGRRMILDADPSPEGNVRLTRDESGGLHARVLPPAEVAHARQQNVSLWLSHHATCPQGARWRRRRRSATRAAQGKGAR
jgi:hypothetical protein